MSYPTITVFLTVQWYFFLLFVSSQHPHRGNFFLVWASDRRQALWKPKTVAEPDYKLRAFLSSTQVTPSGKVVEIKKRQPLVSHSDSTHDPWLSVTFRSLVPLGRSFPPSLRSALGHICLAPLANCFYKHLAFKQSNEFQFQFLLEPICLFYLTFFTFHSQGY